MVDPDLRSKEEIPRKWEKKGMKVESERRYEKGWRRNKRGGEEKEIVKEECDEKEISKIQQSEISSELEDEKT